MRWGCPCVGRSFLLVAVSTASGRLSVRPRVLLARPRQRHVAAICAVHHCAHGDQTAAHHVGTMAASVARPVLGACLHFHHSLLCRADGCTVSPTSLTRVSDALPFSRVFGGTTCSRVRPSISGRLISELAVRSLNAQQCILTQRGAACARSRACGPALLPGGPAAARTRGSRYAWSSGRGACAHGA